MTGDFSGKMREFAVLVDMRSRAVFVNVASAAKDSITDGSPMTGAPGQPVQTGALKGSWQLRFESPTRAVISTDKLYAPAIEDGQGPHGPLTLRSPVGGFHSVALTVAGIPALVADETAKLGGGGA